MSKKLSNTLIIRHNSINNNTESLSILKSISQIPNINNKLNCPQNLKVKEHKFGLLIEMLLSTHQDIL